MTNAEIIWKYFKDKKMNPYGIAGIMGNMQAESSLMPNNLQNTYNTKFGMSDDEYTKAVDDGSYKNFINDAAGYGLVQFTYSGYKKELYNYCKEKGKSISDIYCQLDCLLSQITKSGVLAKLNASSSVRQASDIFLTQYERPADQSEAVQKKRAEYGMTFYNQFATKSGDSTSNSKMKYSNNNKPMVCMMTQSTCYRKTGKMDVKGILWHSTGANNKTLKRYVQPDDNAANRTELLNKIGKNLYSNDWNHTEVQAGLNAWIGTLEDGTVTTIQTMPWDYQPWGCGSGSKGSCNNGWIQFEICEDSLTDANYFNKAYQEAVELTAYLCKLYNLNPNGQVNMNGVQVPTILCHQDSYKLGLGSNHSDVYHWFNKYNKTMQSVRDDVAKLLGKEPATPQTAEPTTDDDFPTLTRLLRKGMVGNDVKALQTYLIKLGYSCGLDGADGDFGNNTYNAVVKFQSDWKIEVDGVVGNETWNTIKKALNGGTQPAPTPTPEPTPTPTPIYSDVMVGSSSGDERGQYHDGTAGDQTSREVWILKWYNSGWHTVIRPKTETLAEKIASACEKGCNNPNIGYDQDQRNTLLAEAKKVGLDLSKITTPCECDCSSFVSTCCVCAGLREDIFFPWGNGCTTHTLAEQCEKSGQFTLLKTAAYTNSKNYLKRGDILLSSGHTVIVLSDGPNAGQIVPTVTTTGSYLVRITADTLNVRAKSTVNSTIVTQVHKGDIYTIIEEREGWGKLKSGVGWISLNYTQRI